MNISTSNVALNELLESLRTDQILTNQKETLDYAKDWTSYFDIQCSGVFFPESTEQTQKIILWANKHNQKIVPSGGRTGLSGGACATQNEWVLSLERMNKILEYSPFDQSLKCQAGVITENIQKFAREKALFYPVDFAARGSSQIGGNLATNAGGIKVLKYGMTRNWVLGLTVITGKGELLEINKGLIKNASGYDIRHLLIGSEGTLGIITEVELQLCPSPPITQTMLLAFDKLDDLMRTFQDFRANLQIHAFEMFSSAALKHVLNLQKSKNPFPLNYDFYAVLEMENKNSDEENSILELFEKSVEQGFVKDGLLAQSEQQTRFFWSLRENISESLAKHSPYKNDLSVRVSKVPELIENLDKVLAKNYPNWEVVWFGHIGDGNLHINILRPPSLTKEDFVKACQNVDRVVFEEIQKLAGSISAEHGVGLTKKPFLAFCRAPEEIEIMKKIKAVFDPNNICNPGKIF